ncbi:MAG: hypothetical protein GX960_12485 [Actinomycetales bacterium]|nr:hypothetical protein [Actinomycetales bacterium]
MRTDKGLRRLALAGAAAGFAVAATVIPQAAFADDGESELLEEIEASHTPYADLEKLSPEDQQQFLAGLEGLSEQRQAEVLQSDEWKSEVSTFGYSDIIWSATEKAACVIHVDLVSCNRAAKDATEASNSAEKHFASNTLHNGKGDAYRHCYWNARMTISIGKSGAMKIASNHEAIGGGPANEKSMDLANNETGRSIGAAQKTYAKSHTQCKSSANSGKLVTLK